MSSRRILITGGAGMLAGRLASFFLSKKNTEVRTLTRSELDIVFRASVENVVEALRPDVVINTAAVLVEPSETDPKRAFQINAWGARNLAMACERCSAVLVQISTSGLFGDEIKPYHEYDTVILKTQYARSKYAGEKYVSALCQKHFIVRLGWLYGGGLDDRKDFVVARLMEAQTQETLQSAGDKYGSPTNADDVARTIEALHESEEYGLYHVANEGGCKRAEYVRTIVKAYGMDVVIEEVESKAFPRKANVPDCEILTSLNLEYAGIPILPHWQESLERYVRQLKKQGTRV